MTTKFEIPTIVRNRKDLEAAPKDRAVILVEAHSGNYLPFRATLFSAGTELRRMIAETGFCKTPDRAVQRAMRLTYEKSEELAHWSAEMTAPVQSAPSTPLAEYGYRPALAATARPNQLPSEARMRVLNARTCSLANTPSDDYLTALHLALVSWLAEVDAERERRALAALREQHA